MPEVTINLSVPVVKSARVLQLHGLFDVPPTERSERAWTVNLPLDEKPWQIGLITGPSGSGKSSLAREAFPDAIVGGYDWPVDRAVVDGFPAGLSIKDVTSDLSSVGFSSPPSWLRPFRCLSTGEQFRATLALALCEPRELVVVDEFTSVVDRTVAQIGSAAVAKAIRRQPEKQFIAVTCHNDVDEWLCPDWTVEMPAGTFTWRSLQQRPPITLEICRVDRSAWDLFKHHHYLDTSLHKSAKCFVAFWCGHPVAFASVLYNPNKGGGFWREHRTVCLPDYQGVGIGNALSAFVGGVMKATGRRYMSTTGNPAMIRHRARSSEWRMRRGPSRVSKPGRSSDRALAETASVSRFTAGFEFAGQARHKEAKRLGVTA